MPTNEFLPFANGSGANTLTQAEYQALADRVSGMGAGLLPSPKLNKILRQSSAIAAAVAQAVAETAGVDMLDDGNVTALKNAIIAALEAVSGGSVIRADLASIASGKGATMLGRGYPVVDSIAQLRGLRKQDPGNRAFVSGYYAAGDGGGGTYYLDATDIASSDNGGTVIVAADGGRWKLVHGGEVSVLQFGAKSDWNGTTGTNNSSAIQAMISDASISKIVGTGGSYWFGLLSQDTYAIQTTRPVIIDWRGAKLFAGEANPAAPATATALIRVLNTGGFVMSNYEFTDTTFSFSNDSRGIQPVQIHNTGTSITNGYTLGPMIIWKGQSLVTAFSANPGVAYAQGIKLVGECRGGDCYYGANLGYSGDDFEGTYSLEKFNRCIFVYDVKNVNARIWAIEGQQSSANLLIASNGYRTTRDIDVQAVIGTINGAVAISGTTTGPIPSVFENVRLDVYAKAAGPNAGTAFSMVRLRCLDGSGASVATDNYSVIRLDVKARSDFRYDYGGFAIETTGPNIAPITVDSQRLFPAIYAGYPKNSDRLFMRPGGKYVVGGTGDLGSSNVILNMVPAIGVGPRDIHGTLRITSVGASSTGRRVSEYKLYCFVNGSGAHSGIATSLVGSVQSGTYNPTFAISAVTTGISVSASSGGAAGAQTTLEFTFDDASA